MPVDRVFIMSGFGAVVTGTLIGGNISKQETMNIMPGGARARVRGVEVHGEQVETGRLALVRDNRGAGWVR